MTKFLYIVDHFIPFPASEYGGVWNVIAESNEECFDLITDSDNEQYPEYYSNLRKNINDARVYTLADDVQSHVVESFTT
jgi:hypothetical protein